LLRAGRADFSSIVREDLLDAVRPAPVINASPPTQPAKAHVAPPPLRETLTPRELEILRLISEGLFNKEIAKRLTLSEETVKTHIRHLLPKLRAHSRAHAVAIAFRQNLVT
jgi:DNA-binding NarL/FixJ family response regulator